MKVTDNTPERLTLRQPGSVLGAYLIAGVCFALCLFFVASPIHADALYASVFGIVGLAIVLVGILSVKTSFVAEAIFDRATGQLTASWQSNSGVEAMTVELVQIAHIRSDRSRKTPQFEIAMKGGGSFFLSRRPTARHHQQTISAITDWMRAAGYSLPLSDG